MIYVSDSVTNEMLDKLSEHESYTWRFKLSKKMGVYMSLWNLCVFLGCFGSFFVVFTEDWSFLGSHSPPIWPQRSGRSVQELRLCLWCFVGNKLGVANHQRELWKMAWMPKKEVLKFPSTNFALIWWMICLTHTIFHSKVSNDTPAGSQVRQGCGKRWQATSLPCLRKDANRNNFRKNRRGKGIKLRETGSPTKTLNN